MSTPPVATSQPSSTEKYFSGSPAIGKRLQDVTNSTAKNELPPGTVSEQFGARKLKRENSLNREPSPLLNTDRKLKNIGNNNNNNNNISNTFSGSYNEHKEYIQKEGIVNYFSSALGLEHIIYNKPHSNSPYSGLSKHAAARKKKLDNIKVEPKVFFANERTFLTWMHTSITLASISVAIVSFSTPTKEQLEDHIEGDDKPWIFPQIYGLTLLPISIFFIFYSLYQYTNRASMIRKRVSGPYDDLTGPSIMAGALVGAIVINFIVKVWQVAEEE